MAGLPPPETGTILQSRHYKASRGLGLSHWWSTQERHEERTGQAQWCTPGTPAFRRQRQPEQFRELRGGGGTGEE